jgi:hypothetical protein
MINPSYGCASLDVLLECVTRLFKTYKDDGAQTHTFTLTNQNGMWSFNVINSWHKWHAKHLRFEFGWFQKPENAVKCFLLYVEQNKINVKKLQY